MARPRKPTATLKKQGTYQPCRRPVNELEIAPGIPSCPAWLDADGKREWRRIVKVLEPYSVITVADRAVLAEYCDAYATLSQAAKAVHREGLTVIGANGVEVQNPNVRTRSDAAKRMLAAGQKIGLSPVARTSISTMKGKDASDSGKDKKEESILSLVS